jgi:endonuclease III related protein
MNSDAALRLRRMHDVLFAAYGPQHWWPVQSGSDARFEVIVGAYLTQNTSWKAVERSLDALRSANVLTVEGMRGLSLTHLQELIRPTGFITRKGPALQAFFALLDSEFGGSLDAMAGTPTRELRGKLLALPGVGPETADAILLYALDHPVPVADEYLRRIAERHDLLPSPVLRNARGYGALVALTTAAFAQEPVQNQKQTYNEFHALIVAVGKAHCGSTPRCENCPLAPDLDPALRRRLSTAASCTSKTEPSRRSAWQ